MLLLQKKKMNAGLHFVSDLTISWRCVSRIGFAPSRKKLSLLSHKFPGPGEDGLMWMHEESKEGVEGFGKFFFGPFPSISVIHPDTVKIILKTSGTVVVCIT